MNNAIHFFDLDGTLWLVKTNAWVINKKKPNSPIFKLKNSELKLILAGVYLNDELPIDYNGKKYWISQKLFDRILLYKPNIDIDDLGISFFEKINPEYYDNVKFYKENIRHLIGKEGFDIGILSARFSDDKDKKILNILKTELENVGLSIDKFYYVGDHYYPTINESVNIRKSNILLEHLVGFHINKDRFVPLKQDLYKDVYFYDDEPNNIFSANAIQKLLNGYLENTDTEVFNRIIKNIKEKHPVLHTNLVTNNSLNRFKTTVTKLTEPIKYPIKIQENKILRFKDL